MWGHRYLEIGDVDLVGTKEVYQIDGKMRYLASPQFLNQTSGTSYLIQYNKVHHACLGVALIILLACMVSIKKIDIEIIFISEVMC